MTKSVENMKKLIGIFAFVIVLAACFASCTPTKQACAAYDQVELDEGAE
jgi:hypothetical protein